MESEFKKIGDFMQSAFDKLVNAGSTINGISGIPSGFKVLDKITSGWQDGDLIAIGGRPGMGKTSFALNIAEHVAINKGKKVAFFSLEMSKEQLVSRMLSTKGQISGQNLRTGRLTDKEWERLIEAGDIISKSQK